MKRICTMCATTITAGTRCTRHAYARPDTQQLRRNRHEFIAQRGHCSECGRTTDLTIDHIQPIARGGADEPHNWDVLCRSCNSAKGWD